MRFSLRLTIPLVAALVLVAGLAPPASAQSTAGGASLQIPPGARAEGMGRFFSAIADDAFTPWWNPAGLAFMTGWNVGLMHAQLVPGLADDVYFEYLGVAKDLKGWGGLAGTITYLNYGESVATAPGSPTEIGTFSSYEISPSLAIGTSIMKNFGIGANLKLLSVNLAPEEYGDGKGTTFAVDLGALYRYNKQVENLFGMGAGSWTANVGGTFANLGPDISLTEEKQSDPLPRNLKLAASWGAVVPQSYSMLLGLALEKSLVSAEFADSVKEELSFYERNELLISGGLELGIMDLIYARTGYIYDDPGEIKGFTFGVGFYLKSVGFDWASIPQYRELDRVNKFSVVARF